MTAVAVAQRQPIESIELKEVGELEPRVQMYGVGIEWRVNVP